MNHSALASTLNSQSRQQARAYAGIGKKRETLTDLREQLRAMTAERDDWRSKYLILKVDFDAKVLAFDELSEGRGLGNVNVNARLVGIQSALADEWGIHNSVVCKLVKQGRVQSAGKDARGRALYYLDQAKPAPKPRGKKRKNNSGSDGL